MPETQQKKTEFTVVPGRPETRLTRVFDAPRRLVYATMTDPAQIPHYWGPAYLDTKVDLWEVRPGGMWRIVQTEPDGHEHAFHGVYHDAVQDERTVSTFEYEGTPGHVLLETVTLEDVGKDRTRLTMQSVFQTMEARDSMVASGAESGAVELMERLAKLVERAPGSA